MVLIKRWSEAESFTIFENHVYTCKKNSCVCSNFCLFSSTIFGRLQVSLQPDCKNLGSGVPSLMAADKLCPQLQPSLVRMPL